MLDSTLGSFLGFQREKNLLNHVIGTRGKRSIVDTHIASAWGVFNLALLFCGCIIHSVHNRVNVGSLETNNIIEQTDDSIILLTLLLYDSFILNTSPVDSYACHITLTANHLTSLGQSL